MTRNVESIAVGGLERAASRLAGRARELASPSDRVSLESSLPGLAQDVATYRANVRVLRAAAEVSEVLLASLER